MAAIDILLGLAGWGSDLFVHDESPGLISAASCELAGCHFMRQVLLQHVAKVKFCEEDGVVRDNTNHSIYLLVAVVGDLIGAYEIDHEPLDS
jgi:hypothetical protein